MEPCEITTEEISCETSHHKWQLKINLNSTKWKYLLKRFQILVNGHTIEFHAQTQKLAVYFKYIVPCESSAEEDL